MTAHRNRKSHGNVQCTFFCSAVDFLQLQASSVNVHCHWSPEALRELQFIKASCKERNFSSKNFNFKTVNDQPPCKLSVRTRQQLHVMNWGSLNTWANDKTGKITKLPWVTAFCKMWLLIAKIWHEMFAGMGQGPANRNLQVSFTTKH